MTFTSKIKAGWGTKEYIHYCPTVTNGDRVRCNNTRIPIVKEREWRWEYINEKDSFEQTKKRVIRVVTVDPFTDRRCIWEINLEDDVTDEDVTKFSQAMYNFAPGLKPAAMSTFGRIIDSKANVPAILGYKVSNVYAADGTPARAFSGGEDKAKKNVPRGRGPRAALAKGEEGDDVAALD